MSTPLQLFVKKICRPLVLPVAISAISLGNSACSTTQAEELDNIYGRLVETQVRVPGQVGDNVPPGNMGQSVPNGFDPGWWKTLVAKPIRPAASTLPITLEQTLIDALDHSYQIRVFSELPLIRETAIIEADAAFDWTGYLDGRWDDISEPIGNALTAGAGVNRFNDHNLVGRGGFRRRTSSGGTFDVSQQLGFQDNNSQFFIPDQQGTSRLSLGFTQPLLRGRGKRYNTSLTLLAMIDRDVANDEFRRQLESHLLEVARAYWALYLERGVLYQKLQNYARGQEILDRLSKRQRLDAQQSQLISAQASLASRGSELRRARAAVRNAESRLRSLVNSPSYGEAEILPIDSPTFEPSSADPAEAVSIALQFRPEVLQSMKQIKAACVRLNMSKHELLPVLNLVTESYLSGLAAEGNSFRGFRRQFDTGAPSYAIGLQFENPIGNRAAKARYQRRRLEIRQLQSQYSTTLETVRHEVEVAVRELATSLDELSTKQRAMNARKAQMDAILARWQRLPGEGPNAALTLENLLSAQDQLAASEFDYLTSQLTYNLSLINLKKVTGLLLQAEQVDIGRTCQGGLPTAVLDKVQLYQADTTVDAIPELAMEKLPIQKAMSIPESRGTVGFEYSSKYEPVVVD